MNTIHNCPRCGLSEMNNNRHRVNDCLSLLKEAAERAMKSAEYELHLSKQYADKVESILNANPR